MATVRWRHRQCTGERPAGRIGHTLVTNSQEDTVYLYGGVNDTHEQNSQYLDDFFAFDFHQKHWRKIVMTGDVQCPRAFHTAVFHGGKTYIFGGCNGRGRFNRLFSIDEQGHCELVQPERQPHVQPLTRYCHSATLFEDQMYVFAGKCGGRNSNKRLQDLWVFNFAAKTWTEVEQYGDEVPARSAHAAFTCGRRMFMFGGRNVRGECCEDIFHFSYDTRHWTKVDTTHSLLFGRARHSVVIHNGRVVIFGGWNGKKKLNDLIFFYMDSETSELVHDPMDVCPSRRECHVAVTCVDTMVVFGGRFRGNFMEDTCELDLGSKRLKDYCRDWLLAANVTPTAPQVPKRVVDYMERWKWLKSIQDPESSAGGEGAPRPDSQAAMLTVPRLQS